MKTSDRLIAAGILVLMLLMVSVTLVLYHQLQTGHIASLRPDEDFEGRRDRLRPVRLLVLDSVLWVNIIPADSDAIGLPKVSDRVTRYRQDGDTLWVEASHNTAVLRPYIDWNNQPSDPVNVYISHLEHLRVINGQVVMKMGLGQGLSSRLLIDADSSTIWFCGSKKAVADRHCKIVYHLTNSYLVLNDAVFVGGLEGQLDALSEIRQKGTSTY